MDDETLTALITLRHTLAAHVWAADTAAGTWSPERPSTGQCAVTALLVQDLFGGELARTVVAGESHYFNVIDGVEVDLTRDQFPIWVTDGPAEARERSYVLSHPDTAARFATLFDRYAGFSTRCCIGCVTPEEWDAATAAVA